jgi:origin recognition complex subunit 5
MNICVVFITAQKWDDMLSKAPAYPPIQVDFPNYTEKEIVQVMMLDIPKDECPSFYEGYVTTIAQTFRSSCKDLGELRYLAALLFPNYIEPVKKGLIKKEESAKLYYSFSKDTLRKQLDTLYLRDVSFSEWNLCGGKLDVSTTSGNFFLNLMRFL